MGVHIWVSKFISKEVDGTADGYQYTYYKTEPQKWFDGIRHTGDREFIFNNDFVFLESDLPVEERRLARLKDSNKAREWVTKNVANINQVRLLEAIDKMEQDESLFFSWSW